MTDPFDALHEPVVPAQPDPRFVAELRERLQLALFEEWGEEMKTVQRSQSDIAASSAEDVRTHTLTPHLAVRGASEAIDWYVDVFGARTRGETYLMDDGRIGHAELAIGDSVLMLADEAPEIGMLGPLSRGGSTVSINVQLPDVDETVRRARERGATLIGEIQENPYGRVGRIDDPFGHRWLVLTPPGPVPAAEPSGPKPGDVSYVTITTPDEEGAKEFYGSVLGWSFAKGPSPRGWAVEDVTPMTGIGGAQDTDVILCYYVADLDTAVARVRELGGEAESPEVKPYGRLASCVDNQGQRFYLSGDPQA